MDYPQLILSSRRDYTSRYGMGFLYMSIDGVSGPAGLPTEGLPSKIGMNSIEGPWPLGAVLQALQALLDQRRLVWRMLTG